MKVKIEREVAQSCPTLSHLMDCSLPGSSIHGISRQEYWSGVPLPSPSGPITSWQIDAETVETRLTLFFWAPKSLQMVITAMKLKKTLTAWMKIYDKLRQHIKKQGQKKIKSRDVTLPTKVCLVKAMVFLVVMYRCESWTRKKAGH